MPARFFAIDLLRFLAALSVLGHHWHWVARADVKELAFYPERWMRHGGYFGVVLFFMISGFVILRSAQGVAAGAFVTARVVRLYPAFWICCTLSWLASFAIPMSPAFGEYLVNLTMFPEALGVRLVDGVYWTLVLEAKFYLLIWMLLVTGKLARIETALWMWLGLSQLARVLPIGELVMADFAPFFVGGCACFLLGQKYTLSRWALLLVAILAGVLKALDHAHLTGSLFRVPPEPVFVVGVVAGCFPLMLAVARGWIRLPGHPLLVAMGALSYPLYLLHKEIGYRLFEVTRGAMLGPLAYILILIGMLLLSWAITRWCEAPLQALLRDRRKPAPWRWTKAGGVDVEKSSGI